MGYGGGASGMGVAAAWASGTGREARVGEVASGRLGGSQGVTVDGVKG